MKPALRIGIGLLSLAGLWTATVAAQSLGDYARQQRAQKPSAPVNVKVYTNDNLPTSGALSEVGQLTPPPSAKASAAAEKADQKQAEDRTKLETEWRAKFAEQKQSIALVERELAMAELQRSQAVGDHYGNGYNLLVANPQYAASVQKADNTIKEKQKALADAKQKLEDMQEQLRKAGLPSSWAD